jgi:hypothetical protein
MAVGSRPPDWMLVIHHRTDELLVGQQTVSDRQATSPVKEGAKHAQSFGCILSHLKHVHRYPWSEDTPVIQVFDHGYPKPAMKISCHLTGKALL